MSDDDRTDAPPAAPLDGADLVARPRVEAYETPTLTPIVRPWATQCAWCRRMRMRSGDWIAVALDDRSWIGSEITHGICADCAVDVDVRASGPERGPERDHAT